MKIIIKETGAQETLDLINSDGINWIGDFVGNTGAMQDGQFTWDYEQDAFIADQSTFDWWKKVVDDQDSLDERISALKEEHGQDAVWQVIQDAPSVDIENHAAAMNQLLDEAFGED